jgi:hypothetical protein
MNLTFASAESGGVTTLENVTLVHIDKPTGSSYTKSNVSASVSKESEKIDSKLNDSNSLCAAPSHVSNVNGALPEWTFYTDDPKKIQWESGLSALPRNQCCRLATPEEIKLFKPGVVINGIETESKIWVCAVGIRDSHMIRYKNIVYVLTYNQMYCHQMDIKGDGPNHKRIHVDGHIYDLENFE